MLRVWGLGFGIQSLGGEQKGIPWGLGFAFYPNCH